MDIARPEDWEEKKELAHYLLTVIEGDELMRNKFANLIVDIFEHKDSRDREADNRLAREALYYLIKNELNQDIRSKATQSGNERPWWI